MPIHGYSVLKGRVIDLRRGSGQSPHYQVLVNDETELYRIAINVESQDGSEVQYQIVSHFDHPLLTELADVAPGLHSIESRPGGMALDYIRGNLVQPGGALYRCRSVHLAQITISTRKSISMYSGRWPTSKG